MMSAAARSTSRCRCGWRQGRACCALASTAKAMARPSQHLHAQHCAESEHVHAAQKACQCRNEAPW
eukprot:13487346-Alexandrium_andersonii.AAC.1